MKKIFTLAAILFSITTFAAEYPGPNDSKVMIRSFSDAYIQVFIDGKQYNVNQNGFAFDNICAGRHQVGGTGAEGGQADAGLAGQAAVGGRHESRGLLVTGQHQPDLRLAQGLQQVEVFLTGNAEYILDTFVFQALHNDIGGLGHLACNLK